MLLENKKVLITGAGRGIGRQTAIDMAKEGAIILGTGRTQAPLDENVPDGKGKRRTGIYCYNGYSGL